ncbi:cation diffusion facilitator family transporter [Clostridia bacterium i40-0019-1A8]
MKAHTPEQTALRVSSVSIVGNILLSGFKLFAGFAARSSALISDAVHSASDVFSTVVVMVGIKVAHRAADKSHPYGHERMECVAAMLLAVLLAATGFGIGATGISQIFSGRYLPPAPGLLALAAAGISILTKEAMFWYTYFAAKRIHSSALMADAWHHRSDALSSIGSFAGILGARLGLPILDPLASVGICLFILKAAWDIFRDAIGKMTDHSCDDVTVAKLQELILKQEGVLGIDDLKTRLFGDRIYVDIEIRADGNKTLTEAHAIAQRTHDAVEAYFPTVKHCMIHVNPMVLEIPIKR